MFYINSSQRVQVIVCEKEGEDNGVGDFQDP